MILTFENGGHYAPCMVIVAPKSERWRARIRRHMVAAGMPDHPDYETFLISYDEAAELLRPAAYRDLENGWTVSARIDTFSALTMFGHDANTLTPNPKRG